jgi:class 3 adenylate cyclase/tetratricopeptide (TPR) repeat protein
VVGCHRCGRRSRVGARFCGGCGAVLGSARAGVRKTVTVLFADAPALGPPPDDPLHDDVESGVRTAAAFYDCLRQVLVEHGGTVERHAGDAVMAVFGIPAARDDDARRAAAAALAVQRAVRSLPGQPQVSVGINTGEVLTGDGTQGEDLAVGEPVVVAARLQQQAGPGEVLLGPATVRLLGRGARVGAGRELVLRGRVGSLPVVPLEGLEAVVDVPVGGPFVGREPELRMLRGVLDRTTRTASAGSRGIVQLVTVLGEAGTGKSRLVHEVLAERADELVVLRGTCRGYGDRSDWSAIVEVLHDVTGVPSGDGASVVLAHLARQRPELTGVLPVLASLLGDGDTPVGLTELSWALARALAVVAGDGPVVVLLEDLHLADGPLLDLLPEVVRRLEGSPVAVVVTGRPELLEHRSDWGRGLRHVLGLTLRPLDPDAARQLAEQLLPGDPAGVEALLGPADGNPLFLEQLAQAHVEGTGAAAPSVTAVLSARLDRLPLETRQVLERAAVIGSWGRVADLRPLCEGEQEIDLDEELKALARRDLLVVEDGRWSFGSELVREAAAGGTTRDDRAELHHIRAMVLAAQGANGSAGFHFEQASLLLRAADPDRSAALAKQAAARLAAAGRRALTGDLVAAGDLLARACGLMPRDHPRRLDLLPELARARQLAGDLAGAGSVLEEAVVLARQLGLVEPAAHARLARVDLLRSTDPERAWVELPGLLEEVLPVLEQAHDDQGLSLAWQLQAAGLQYRVRWAAMEPPLEKALHHARRAGDRRLEELAQELLVSSDFHGPMHLEESRPRLEALLERPGTSPSHRAYVEARLAGVLALQGDPATARASMARVRKVLRDLGRELSAVASVAMSAPVELLAGEPDRAAAQLQEACEAVTSMGHLAWVASLSALLAEAHWRCGEPERAADAVQVTRASAGVGDVISQVRWRAVQAKLLAAQGRAEPARALAEEAVRLVATTDEVTSQGDVLADAAQVHELLGDVAAGQALLHDALARYERKGATQAVRGLAERLLVLPGPGLPSVAALVPDQPAGGRPRWDPAADRISDPTAG